MYFERGVGCVTHGVHAGYGCRGFGGLHLVVASQTRGSSVLQIAPASMVAEGSGPSGSSLKCSGAMTHAAQADGHAAYGEKSCTKCMSHGSC